MNNEIVYLLQTYFRNKPVKRAYIFGSFARNESSAVSDIDLLVELDYKNGADYFLFFDMKKELSSLLNREVDLVSSNGISKYLQPIIDKEKKLVYEGV